MPAEPGNFWTKIIFIIVCFLEGFLSGCFPTWSKGCRENPKILGIANAFASGVFIAIALVHILPEEAEEWAIENDYEDVFPLPYFLMFCGYTLILLLDKVLFDPSVLHKEGAFATTEDPVDRKLSMDIKRSLIVAQQTGQDPTPEIEKAVGNYNNKYDNFAVRMSDALTPEEQEATQLNSTSEFERGQSQKIQDAKINPSEMMSQDDGQQNLLQVKSVEDEENPLTNSQRTKIEGYKKNNTCNCTPFMLMIALSVHSIFEGVACGLQTKWGQTMQIVIAIVVHKGAAGSALGISLVKNFPENFRMVRQLVFMFAIATPVGVVIGMFCANAGEKVDVIMSSLAGGTFIYIGCTEIVVHEFSNGGHKILKLVAYLCGAALITSLCFMAGS